LELEAPYQLVHEVVQPQKQPSFQVEGIQSIEAPNNEPQQPVTTYVSFHQIHIGQEKQGNHKYLQFVDF
jgi:hypothetical protein